MLALSRTASTKHPASGDLLVSLTSCLPALLPCRVRLDKIRALGAVFFEGNILFQDSAYLQYCADGNEQFLTFPNGLKRKTSC